MEEEKTHSGDELDRVGASGVLSDGDVVVVGLPIRRVVDDVLEDRSELDGVVDFGLLLLGQVDALGVAAALDVEDSSVGPDVLVVSDEQTFRVGREGAGGRGERGDTSMLACWSCRETGER
jgi:hypothetical protein